MEEAKSVSEFFRLISKLAQRKDEMDKQRKVQRIDEDETIMAAIRDGRHAEDIFLLDCPWCGVPSYYNQGSHFTCRVCDRTVQVVDDDSGTATSVHADDMYSLADYWKTGTYPCDQQKWFCPVCGSTTHQHCSKGCASCDDPKSPMPRYASTFCGTCAKSFCIECMKRHVCTGKVN